MRRAGVVVGLIAVTAVAVGCASTGHTWQDEFTARLEGTAGSVEVTAEELHSQMNGLDDLRAFPPLARNLNFKGELIEGLDPPRGCEAVQMNGEHAIRRFASVSYHLPKDMTPYLGRRLPAIFEEEVAKLEKLEREAMTCATG